MSTRIIKNIMTKESYQNSLFKKAGTVLEDELGREELDAAGTMLLAEFG